MVKLQNNKKLKSWQYLSIGECTSRLHYTLDNIKKPTQNSSTDSSTLE